MSLLKQVKSVLKSKEVSQLVIHYENGSVQEYAVDGKKGKSEIKNVLNSIDWEEVAEVQFVLKDDEDEGDDDDDDDDDD